MVNVGNMCGNGLLYGMGCVGVVGFVVMSVMLFVSRILVVCSMILVVVWYDPCGGVV